MKNNIILCIVAHPDDEALGVGGTLISHVKKGDKVFIVILSNGEDSKYDRKDKTKDRIFRAEKWANFSGCNLLQVFNFPDQRLDSIPQLDIVIKIENIIKEVKPDIVYTHSLSDINKDHKVTAYATLAATRPISSHKINPEIRAFETPSSTDQAPAVNQFIFTPNLYIDITKYWSLKEESLNFYNSELKNFPHPRSIEAIKALAIKRGSESGLKFAEAFCLYRKVIM